MNQSELEAQTKGKHQARENMQPVPSAGKHATGAKRGKTCNQRATGVSARKYATSAKPGKICIRQGRIVFGVAPNWMKKTSCALIG